MQGKPSSAARRNCTSALDDRASGTREEGKGAAASVSGTKLLTRRGPEGVVQHPRSPVSFVEGGKCVSVTHRERDEDLNTLAREGSQQSCEDTNSCPRFVSGRFPSSPLPLVTEGPAKEEEAAPEADENGRASRANTRCEVYAQTLEHLRGIVLKEKRM